MCVCVRVHILNTFLGVYKTKQILLKSFSNSNLDNNQHDGLSDGHAHINCSSFMTNYRIFQHRDTVPQAQWLVNQINAPHRVIHRIGIMVSLINTFHCVVHWPIGYLPMVIFFFLLLFVGNGDALI